MIYTVIVYSLAVIGFFVVIGLIAVLITSLWCKVDFSISNKERKDGKD